MADIGKLQNIKVAGFKSIKKVDFDLQPSMNLLVGSNGAGKSNFIGIFRLMNNIVEHDLQLFVGQRGKADKFLHFGAKVTDEIRIDLKFVPNSYHCTLVPTATNGLVFKEEYARFYPGEIEYQGGIKRFPLAKAGAEETGLPRYSAGRPSIADRVAQHFRGWHIYHFHDTSDTAHVKKSGRITDARELRADAVNLAAYLRRIRQTHPDAYDELVATVQRVAPFFHDFILEPSPLDPSEISLQWKHRGTDAFFDASDLSDGTLRFICLATLLLQPVLPTTILLDEPELGLHPYAIQLLAGLMRSAASRTQIIAATQSITLANQFSYEDLIVVDREDNASVFRRLTESEVAAWLDDYGMGDIWQKNLIGGTP
ncbi:AAA family ATPase [Nitrospirillum sp. BR 11828]|uniref:AAA family ATPase n=1 Tax=Nitrospirillum sp. BR 11828 TaxID=3104325 RepID=UPI002ACA1779|nr:AAA family ATPase [Nitrospirillum sp. BR 11828]MDZ5647533.1 AAA family ATPase [Nitrospirillum sp. BR 11828]